MIANGRGAVLALTSFATCRAFQAVLCHDGSTSMAAAISPPMEVQAWSFSFSFVEQRAPMRLSSEMPVSQLAHAALIQSFSVRTYL
jgi:hypothetical protein